MRDKKIEYALLLEEQKRREAGRVFFRTYPEEGKFSRYAYPKHMEIFGLGSVKPIRLAVGGNGIGKTFGIGCYETTCHATGIYPDWWEGKRYTRPTDIYVAGNTKEDVRTIIQPKLVGKRGDYGTGMIPRDLIGEVRLRQGGNDAIDFMKVKHRSGGWSQINFKAYEQGAEAFMGFEADFIWLDEEPPGKIYSECSQRFRTRDPAMLITFTPLNGISEVVSMFMPQFAQDYSEAEYEASGRAYVLISQDEVPHLTEVEKKRMQANSLAHEREARRTGVPSIGKGKIYPVEEASFIIPAFSAGIPRHWPRLYGMDPGLNRTAAVWGAWDRDVDCIYLYAEHYVSNQLPPMHATAIKARGVWIPGMIDPSSRNRNAKDGEALLKTYRELGLRLIKADNAVDSGILDVQTRLETGGLKVCEHLTNWISEFRRYRRDDKGKIVKLDDHLMDATRYLIRGINNATTQREAERPVPAMQEVTFGSY